MWFKQQLSLNAHEHKQNKWIAAPVFAYKVEQHSTNKHQRSLNAAGSPTDKSSFMTKNVDT